MDPETTQEVVKAAATVWDAEMLMAIAYPFALAIAAIGSAWGLSKAVSSAMDAMARQPNNSGAIMNAMIVGCAFIEALAIYMLISPFIATLSFFGN